jgi:2-polyprenyl-3-methyl-5-hydroxy-6-metoxy-1,4-benzoquinol methylase
MGFIVERISQNFRVPPWVRRQHIARYRWASCFTRGCKVIDAACGIGYGAKILLDRGAERIDGFDLSTEAIQTARVTYPNMEKLSFEKAGVTNLPISDHSYDVFVSMETIEHIENDTAFLKEARRVLKPNGKFICSTPNRKLTNPGTPISRRPFNPHHVREYTLRELESKLREQFHTIEFYGQTPYERAYTDFLEKLGKTLPRPTSRLHQIRKLVCAPWDNLDRHNPIPMPIYGEPEILLAVCT